MQTTRLAALAALLLLSACQTAPSMQGAQATQAGAVPPMSRAVHWYRQSAEMKAVHEQTYALALGQLRAQVATLPRGSWAIIMDVDETLLDNSDYARQFPVYDPASWDQWTARKSARPLPGAVRFTVTVRQELGGKVMLVTNREQHACADTEVNLRNVGIGYDGIFCKTTVSDKNPRFAAIAAGAGGAPLNVLMWFGDNIQDFPGSTQSQFDISQFGRRYFVFPNPTYGSWESLPQE